MRRGIRAWNSANSCYAKKVSYDIDSEYTARPSLWQAGEFLLALPEALFARLAVSLGSIWRR
jgi:hypothetical protein